MISFGPTVDRLKAAGFSHAEGVLEFLTYTTAPRVSPALFVIPARDVAAPNRMSGVIDQKVSETFSVAIVIAAERLAGKLNDELVKLERRVVDALLGWKHPEASGPCEYAGGQLTSLEGGRVTWTVSFTSPRHIRKGSQ